MLGSQYYSGHGVEKSITQAKEYFEKSAEAGFKIAQFKLGNMYYYGQEIAKDYELAAKYYQQSASSGYANAQLMMGVIHSSGHGVKKSNKEAVKWYQQAADNGSVFALVQLGAMYSLGKGVIKNYQTAISLFEKALAKGNNEALVYLGDMYYNGNGYSKDTEKALALYQKGAEQGDARAEYIMGKFSESGEASVIEQNNDAAYSWFLKAAEKGHKGARLSLGYLCYKRDQLPNNQTEAKKWFMLAAKEGNAEAQLFLGQIYLLENNYQEALYWHELAAHQKNPVALYNLGYLHFNGLGTEKNRDKGIEFYTQAAYKGDVKAMSILGNLFFDSNDSPKGVKWTLKAAIQGEALAQLRLGHIFNQKEKHFISKNISEAKKWYSKAAEQGNQEAVAFLNAINQIAPVFSSTSSGVEPGKRKHSEDEATIQETLKVHKVESSLESPAVTHFSDISTSSILKRERAGSETPKVPSQVRKIAEPNAKRDEKPRDHLSNRNDTSHPFFNRGTDLLTQPVNQVLNDAQADDPARKNRP